MSTRPSVIDTGHTVSLLHRLYEIRYPDGTTEEVFVAECHGTPSQNCERVKRRARATWAKRRGQTG